MKLQQKLHTGLIILVDLILLTLSLYIALVIRYFFDSPDTGVWSLFVGHIFYFIPLYFFIVTVLYVSLAYNDTTLAYLKRSIPKLAESVTIAMVLGVAYFYIFGTYLPISPKITYVLFFAVAFLILSVSRVVYAKLPLLGAHINALVLMKEGSVFEVALAQLLQQAPRATFVRLKEFNVEDVMCHLEKTRVSSIVYDNTDKTTIQIISMLPTHIIRSMPIISKEVLYEQFFGKVFLPTFSEESLLRDYLNKKPYFEITKRVFDLVVAIPLLILTAPLIAIAALAIYFETGRPIFIFQERLGIGRRVMRIPKLRTMYRNDNNGKWIYDGENKVTPIGAIIRKSRIDEFPQLWSVIKGDMSLIGPRPDMTGHEAKLREEIEFYHARYTVPPGLSGWAQVTQDVVPQSVEETRERFAYDMYYIKHRSVFLDFSIALKTVRILLSRMGR